jgi:hypothetical protein
MENMIVFFQIINPIIIIHYSVIIIITTVQNSIDQ